MKKIFFISVAVFCLFIASCSKNDETTYLVPTENKTDIDTDNHKVVRTQVINEGKQAVEITYLFDGSMKYNHQTWKVFFSTDSGAKKMGVAATLYYALKLVDVSYSANIVSINYPFGEGLGDEKLASITTLSEVENVVQITEILNILGLF